MVVAIHVMSANASSYTSLVVYLRVEVMSLSVGQSSNALLASGRRSVVCHFFKLGNVESECEERRKKIEGTAVYRRGRIISDARTKTALSAPLRKPYKMT